MHEIKFFLREKKFHFIHLVCLCRFRLRGVYTASAYVTANISTDGQNCDEIKAEYVVKEI